MRWQLERVSGPDIEAISLAEMKIHLRAYASDTSRDDEIEELIQAAREWVEELTGQVMIEETWCLSIDQGDQWLDEFVNADDSTDFYLRRSPVLSVVSVETVDADGTETTVSASQYQLVAGDSKFPYIAPTSSATWQDSNLKITFRAGYANRSDSPQQDASVVPARFKQAMKMWVSGMYDKDEHASDVAMALAKSLKAQVGFA